MLSYKDTIIICYKINELGNSIFVLALKKILKYINLNKEKKAILIYNFQF